MSDEGENVAERLMGALISKMEDMDSSLQVLKSENARLKRMMDNPAAILRKAGFVSTKNGAPEDVLPDVFRGDGDQVLLKGEEDFHVPKTNIDFHNTDWSDIHTLADQAKSAGAIGNQIGME